MPLVIETGTIITAADSYVSLESAATYHLNRGNTAWGLAASDTLREQALRRAVAYLDGKYYPRWKGAQVSPLVQCLQWPRKNANLGQSTFDLIPSTLIPQRLKDAQCELALRALSGDLAEDLDRGGLVQSVQVGPVTQTFSDRAPAAKTYQIVEQLLAPLLEPANVCQLVRS